MLPSRSVVDCHDRVDRVCQWALDNGAYTQQNRSRCLPPPTKQIVNSVNPNPSRSHFARQFRQKFLFDNNFLHFRARFHPFPAGFETMQLQAIFVSRDDSTDIYYTGRYIDSTAIHQAVKPSRLCVSIFEHAGARRSPYVPLSPPFPFSIFLSFSFPPRSAPRFEQNRQIPRGALATNDSTTDTNGQYFSLRAENWTSMYPLFGPTVCPATRVNGNEDTSVRTAPRSLFYNSLVPFCQRAYFQRIFFQAGQAREKESELENRTGNRQLARVFFFFSFRKLLLLSLISPFCLFCLFRIV